MDAQSKHFRGSGSQACLIRHRPICIKNELPGTGVRTMATRVECSCNRSIQSDMELASESSISSIHPDSSVTQKDTERSSTVHSHCTSLEKQTLVSQFFCQFCHTSLYYYLSPDFFFSSQEQTRFTPSVHKSLSD